MHNLRREWLGQVVRGEVSQCIRADQPVGSPAHNVRVEDVVGLIGDPRRWVLSHLANVQTSRPGLFLVTVWARARAP